MNAHFTREPTPTERGWAVVASEEARTLVRLYANEVSDAREWPNRDNVENTRTVLLAYIARLEAK